jgi:hypothetical protein
VILLPRGAGYCLNGPVVEVRTVAPMTIDDETEPAPTADAVLEGLREAVPMWEDYREATTPIGQAGSLIGFANAFFHLSSDLAEHDLAPTATRQVWLLWEGDDLVSIHSTGAGAEVARQHVEEMRTELGESHSEAWFDAHDVGVTWRVVQD